MTRDDDSDQLSLPASATRQWVFSLARASLVSNCAAEHHAYAQHNIGYSLIIIIIIILPWSRGKRLAWDVTVPDTYADAHVSNTAMETGAAASLAATNTANYPQLTSSLQWPLKQPVSGTTRKLSWSRNCEGGRPSSQETPERPPTRSGSYQWLCKRGTRSRFRTRSQPASLLQPFIYLAYFQYLVPTALCSYDNL